MTKQLPQRAVENDARVEIRTQRGFPHVLGKASHKTLRLSHIYHSPDGSLLAPQRPLADRAVLISIEKLSRRWGALQIRPIFR